MLPFLIPDGDCPIDPHLLALADAEPRCFWLDRPDRPKPRMALAGDQSADLLIAGGGFTGLWAAIHAKEDDPDREVVLLEADAIAVGASGRNGGFADPSLTHGIHNGLHHFAGEMPALEKLGNENSLGYLAALERYGIDANVEQTGSLAKADRNQGRRGPWLSLLDRLHLGFDS